MPPKLLRGCEPTKKRSTADVAFLTKSTSISTYVERTTWTEKTFKVAADDIIGKRNKAFHPVDVQGVDSLVNRAKNAIRTYPPRILKNGSIILNDYDNIKSNFPAA